MAGLVEFTSAREGELMSLHIEEWTKMEHARRETLQYTEGEHSNRQLHRTSPSHVLQYLQETQKSCPAASDATFQTEFLCL